MPGTLCSRWLACPPGRGRQARLAQTDGQSRTPELHPHQQPEGTGLSRQGQEAARAVFWDPLGTGWGWGTPACALSPAAADGEPLAGAPGWARRGAATVPGAPRAHADPCPPRHILQQRGLGAQALLSAGLSPRLAASSLKEGRSLGLGAQQCCISLARRDGQPSGCGSFVFPDCRPGTREKSKGPSGRAGILSEGCERAAAPRAGWDSQTSAVTQPVCPPRPQENQIPGTTQGAPRTC